METIKKAGVPSETLVCFVTEKAATDNISDRLCCLSCENPSQPEKHPNALRGWRDGCSREGTDKMEALRLLCTGVALNDRAQEGLW